MIEKQEDALYADGFDDCLIGHALLFSNVIAVYSMDKVIESLMKDGMDRDEAIEYFYFNISGAYVGEKTPAFMLDA